MRTRLLFCVYCFAQLAIISGCSSSNNSKTTPPPTTIPITVSVSPTAAATGSGGAVSFTGTITGDTTIDWSVNGTSGGNSTVGTIDSSGNYSAPTTTTSEAVTITAASHANSQITATATVNVVATGIVANTNNPQVALYTITPPTGASVYIRFGQDTTYPLKTWTRPSLGIGGPVSIFVMGMIANTPYHMQAQVDFADGSSYTDPDQLFSTGGLPTNVYPTLATTTPSGLKPQSGVELINLALVRSASNPQAIATDLAGNIIWYYQYTDGTTSDNINPIRQIPNGDFLLNIGPNSSNPANNVTPVVGTINVIREIDPAGNIVHQLSVSDLNTKLATAGYNLNVITMHHDVLPLPNGHLILIVNSTKQFTNLIGLPGTTTVLGDQLVDLDPNFNPVWVWNSFDHLDVNRHPYLFPDWLHSNAVLYTSGDDLLLSMRHQNWIIKIDYKNGTGTGNIVWHLGEQGDFTLSGGTDPQDWFYAQHYPSIFHNSLVGSYGPSITLGMIDNGDDRIYPNGETCQSLNSPLCPNYTTVPVLTVDETAMTATFDFHAKLPVFSFFGGAMELLQNNNIEYDLCAIEGANPPEAIIREVTPDSSQTLVWQMTITGSYAYRAFRMPSLYPSVQW